ncbi:MAG: hypothetical protein ABJE66_26935 [Deltaproteobacteria bacterium]
MGAWTTRVVRRRPNATEPDETSHPTSTGTTSTHGSPAAISASKHRSCPYHDESTQLQQRARSLQPQRLRFLFSIRAKLPDLLDEAGKPLYKDQPFEPGKDYIVREAGKGGGYVVSFGETVYRALDAVITSAFTRKAPAASGSRWATRASIPPASRRRSRSSRRRAERTRHIVASVASAT